MTDHGYIKVNERLQTTAPGVWAIGEVAGSPQFTHISVDDFRVVHANITGGSRVTTGRQVLIVCLPILNSLTSASVKQKQKRRELPIACLKCRWKSTCVLAHFRKCEDFSRPW